MKKLNSYSETHEKEKQKESIAKDFSIIILAIIYLILGYLIADSYFSYKLTLNDYTLIFIATSLTATFIFYVLMRSNILDFDAIRNLLVFLAAIATLILLAAKIVQPN